MRRGRLASLVLACAACGSGELPAVLAIDPPAGPARGGDVVVIAGEGLREATAVRFGDRAAPSVHARDDGALEVVTPASIAGPVDVAVELPGGELAVAAKAFTFAPLDLAFVDAPAWALPIDPAWGVVDVAPADFDGDGRTDLYLARRGAPGHLLFGDGRGGFEDRGASATIAAHAVRAAIATDLDGDGAPDVVLCNDGGEPTTLLRGDGHGGLAEDAGALPRSADECQAIATADVDGDGRRDLVIVGRGRAGGGASYVRVFTGTTDAGEAPTLAPLASIEAAPKAEALPCDGFTIDGARCSIVVGGAGGLRAAHLEVDATGGKAKATLATTPPALTSAPASLSLAVRKASGTASAKLAVAIVDAKGETFRRDLGAVTSSKWKTLEAPAIASFSHEGGEGAVDLPLASITFELAVDAGATAAVELDEIAFGLPAGTTAIIDDLERTTFALAWDEPLSAIALGDLDGDRALDLVVAGGAKGAPAAHLALQRPGAGFSRPGDGALATLVDVPSAIALLDADGDDDLDLVAIGDGQDRLYANDGTAHLADATPATLPVDRTPDRSFALADLDLDGRLDLALATDGGQSRLYLGRAGGRFFDATPALPLRASSARRVVAIDVDLDGDLDLVEVEREGASRILISSNRGKGER